MKNKQTLLMILDILNENTDSEHILACNEIIRKIDANYDIKVDRRTIYSDINLLIDYGYDISTYEDNGKGYYLASRPFDKSQILLLCNAVHSSNFIPKKLSDELINKLLNTQNKYVNKEYKENVYVENSKKKDNKELFLNIEIISEAIRDHKTISFNYTEYDFDKKLITRNKKPYIVSPYYMITDNNVMFLVGKFSSFKELTHFRLDRIKDIKISNIEYEELKNRKDAYEYAKNKTYMYAGDEIKVKLKCKKVALDSLIDIFGIDINIIKVEKDYFITTVKTTEQGMYHLALHFVNTIEVLEPLELRKKVKNALDDASKKYK